jgi:DNA polymerase I-like protein with 3'-5' exonuclease and polymerase domains
MMLGELFMLIKDMKDVKLINTIHDSIMLDVHQSQLKTICTGLNKFLTDVPKYAKLHLGIELDLPFPVEVEYGRDWGNMKQYKETI